MQVLLAVMSGAFSLAGYYFGRKPTSAMSETDVSMASSAMPWQVDDPDQDDDSKNFKYQYHPRGDKNARPKKAPSALNTVIIPNVTLPKVWPDSRSRHSERLTQTRTYTMRSISGEKMATRHFAEGRRSQMDEMSHRFRSGGLVWQDHKPAHWDCT